MRPALLWELGRVEYQRALVLQHEVHQQRVANRIPDTLLLLEHPPVITFGRTADKSNLLVAEAELTRLGIAVKKVERGGDVTYHGPGQLVGYPIFHLREGLVGVRRFVEGVETALVLALQDLGIPAEVQPKLVGVWVKGKKIASIGIAVREGVTLHGFALNVKNDLSGFRLIHPCGMRSVAMTAIEIEVGMADPPTVRAAVVSGFERVFGLVFQKNLPRSLTTRINSDSVFAIDSASA